MGQKVYKLEYYNYYENSDKFYKVIKVENANGSFDVVCEYGRTGSYPTKHVKAENLTDRGAGKVIHDLIIKKEAKGYQLVSSD